MPVSRDRATAERLHACLFAAFAAFALAACSKDSGNKAALSVLVHDAEASRSDALVVMVDGRVVVENYFGHDPGPVPLMSDTKSVVAILVGMLIDDKKIASIDAPLSTWFPEWHAENKAKVSLRHVLSQTTGLEHRHGDAHLRAQPDELRFVRESPLVEEPGAAFAYNNEATELLAGVIAAAAGEPADAYAAKRLFAPLGITKFDWE